MVMGTRLRNIRISTYGILLLTVYIFIYGLNLKKYQKGEIIQHDVISYYAYLPAFFIFHDLQFDFVADLPEDSPVRVWTHPGPAGTPVLKMTMGVAVLNAPFFLMAHLLSVITGSDTNGYTPLYQIFIFFAAVFYFATGFFFLRRVLRKYFPEGVTGVSFQDAREGRVILDQRIKTKRADSHKMTRNRRYGPVHLTSKDAPLSPSGTVSLSTLIPGLPAEPFLKNCAVMIIPDR